MRKAWVCVAGAWYHVVARTNRKELLMESAVAKEMFLEVLVRAEEKYCFRIDNFIVMGNHFHLLIKPLAGESLAVIMRYIIGVYVMAHNRVYHLRGRLWGGRYFSRPIQGFAEYLGIYECIDQNPIRAGLVVRAADWKYSGLAHHQIGDVSIIDPVLPCICLLMPSHCQHSLEGGESAI